MQKKDIAVLSAALIALMVLAGGICQAFGQTSPPEHYTALVQDRELVPLLKHYFPNAYVGVADTVYQTVSCGQMLGFLEQDPTDSMARGYSDYVDSDDFAWALLGNMSETPEWARVPFGYVVRTKCGFVSNEEAVFLNIFVAKEEGRLVIYEINPMTDEIWKVVKPELDVLVVMI